MNSCILMAEIVQEPQLRYTPDQTALAEMLVQFSGPRSEDPPATLKVVGWGNLAQEIQQNYHPGDHVIIEGRLTMSTVERQEGFKEKRAELTVQRIHPLGAGVSIGSSAASTDDATSGFGARTPDAASRKATAGVSGPSSEQVEEMNAVDVFASREAEPLSKPTTRQPNYSAPKPEADVDDIPF